MLWLNLYLALGIGLVLGAMVYSLVLLHVQARRMRELTEGSRAALQNIQIQLAFLAGRVGLNNRDLQQASQRATEREPDPAEHRPEVIGGNEWNDLQELLDRAEAGEVNLEDSDRPR